MSIFHALADLEGKGGNGALCTVISSKGSTPRHEGSKMLVYPDATFKGTVGGGEMESRVITEAILSMGDGKTRRLTYSMVNPQEGDPGVCGGTVEIFIEPLRGKSTLLIVGGGHVGRALAHLGKWLGFRVAVSDDRPEFCTPDMHPDADAFYPVHLKDLPKSAPIDDQTYVVLVTRGVAIDIPGVPALLETKAAYIGIIGSKRRWLTTKQALFESGLSEEKIQSIRSPIGLELNAETPEEIAVSIMAEIIMLRNGGNGSVMRL
jgi:xanthine dehydrogenase accessory factor